MANILERQEYLLMAGRLSAVVWAKERGTWSDTFSGTLDALYNQLMDDENLFCYDNEQRKDQKLGPTTWFMELYNAMVEFVEAGPYTDDPGVVYHCKEWIKWAKEWYPGLNVNESKQQQQEVQQTPDDQDTPHKGEVAINPDRVKLSELFNDDFKSKNGQKESRFDLFYNNISKAKFVTKDWARMACAIQDNNKIVANQYRATIEPFTSFAKVFFNAVGAKPPEDLHRNKYEDYEKSPNGNLKNIIRSLLK